MVSPSQEPMEAGREPGGMVVSGGRTDRPWSPGGEAAEYDGGFETPGGVVSRPGAGLSVSALLRHKWLMLVIFVLTAGLAIPPIWMLVEPEYSATALVRVAPQAQILVFRTESNSTVPLYRNYLNSQVSTIRTITTLNRVLDRREIQDTHWYKQEGNRFGKAELPALDRLMDRLRVQPRPDTELIEVSMTTQRGQEAKLIVDAVVQEYDKLMKERANAEFLSKLEKVRLQYDRLDQQIKGLQEVKFALAQDSGLLDSQELRGQLVSRVNTLDAQHRDVRRELQMLMARREHLVKQKESQGDPAGDTAPEEPQDDLSARYVQDVEWRGLEKSRKDAQHALELTRQRYGESHPAVRHGVSQVEHAERLLRDRESQLQAQWELERQNPTTMPATGLAQAAPAALEILIPARELERELLLKDMEAERAKVKVIQQIARHEEQIAAAQQEFQDVRRRVVELETESKASGRVSVESHAFAPSEPTRDRRAMLSVMMLGGAVGLALVAGYLRTSLDSRIREEAEVRRISRAPFLGVLPLLPRTLLPGELGGVSGHALLGEGGGKTSGEAPGGANGMLALTEGMRMVRTALLERLEGATHRAILIASPSPRTGKTSAALLLARSLAVIGKRVLLVEGDFYHPCLAERLGCESRVGLATLLSGTTPVPGPIRPTAVTNMDVLLAGEVPEEFSCESLANGVFAAAMARWRASYDFVILDSPPVLPVADARILASHVDGTLMLLRASHSRRSEVEEAYRQLSATRGGVIGAILIGERERSGYGHGYGYGYGYGYGNARGTGEKSSRD